MVREVQPVQPYTLQYLLDQARRTETTRQFLIGQVDWEAGAVVFDLGCGPGAITEELCRAIPHVTAVGLDIDRALLEAGASRHQRQARLHLVLADATWLPFRSSCVAFVLSHFVLMWIRNREQALSEVQRVLEHRGVMAAIEPDYGGRIEAHATTDTIPRFSSLPIVKWLTDAGANPYTGSQLPAELRRIGLKSIRFGVLAWEHDAPTAQAETHGEAALLEAHDIRWSPPDFSFTPIFWLFAKKL
jgi:ubiquinone/menaquinone biosynthesis C-methylase UbiE